MLLLKCYDVKMSIALRYHHFTALIKIDNAIKKPISQSPQKRKLDNCAVIFLNSLIIDRISFKLSINLRSLIIVLFWNEKPQVISRYLGFVFFGITELLQCQ